MGTTAQRHRLQNVTTLQRLLLAFMAALPLRAPACTCAPPPGPGPAVLAFYADVVFIGTVDAVTPDVIDDSLLPRLYRKFILGQPYDGFAFSENQIRVTTTKVFKGSLPLALTIRTPDNGGACGVPFQVGTTYLVFARRRHDTGPLIAEMCSGTMPLDHVPSSDLEALARLQAVAPRPRASATSH